MDDFIIYDDVLIIFESKFYLDEHNMKLIIDFLNSLRIKETSDPPYVYQFIETPDTEYRAGYRNVPSYYVIEAIEEAITLNLPCSIHTCKDADYVEDAVTVYEF